MVAPAMSEDTPPTEDSVSMTYPELEAFVVQKFGDATAANIKTVLDSTRISLK